MLFHLLCVRTVYLISFSQFGKPRCCPLSYLRLMHLSICQDLSIRFVEGYVLQELRESPVSYGNVIWICFWFPLFFTAVAVYLILPSASVYLLLIAVFVVVFVIFVIFVLLLLLLRI